MKVKFTTFGQVFIGNVPGGLVAGTRVSNAGGASSNPVEGP